MTASRPDRGPITVFDRDVMAITAVAAPEVMDRVAANVLGALDELPAHEREALLDTLEAWFDHGVRPSVPRRPCMSTPIRCASGYARSSSGRDARLPNRVPPRNCVLRWKRPGAPARREAKADLGQAQRRCITIRPPSFGVNATRGNANAHPVRLWFQ